MTEGRSAAEAADSGGRPLGWGTIGLLAAFVYIVVAGGTGSGELSPVLRAITAVVGAALVVACILLVRRDSDRVDRLVIVALVLFAWAGATSMFPRQSFDAVLAATAYAAAFVVARRVVAASGARRLLERAFMALSLVFTVGAAVAWLPSVVHLWALSDWRVFPPLNLPLSAGPWGYRYDLVLVVALLYPAWWIGRPAPLRMAIGVIIGLLALALVVMTGSRTLWLAFALATVTVGAPALVRLWRTHRRLRLPLLGALGAAAVVATVLSGPLIERALNFASLGYRRSLWEPLLGLWSSNPITGVGPGSFPWALQLTPYFDTNAWAPRHPDTAVIQVLVEAGLLGALAIVVILAAVGPAVWRGPSTAARWVLVASVLASLGTNPTDFPFLVAILIAWAAYATPRSPVAEAEGGRRHLLLRGATAGALVIAGIAQSLMLAGTFAYQSARQSVGRGDVSGAVGALGTAAALDPGIALYQREQGIAWLVLGDPTEAVTHLAAAARMNPADDLALRAKALALTAMDDRRGAIEAVEAALDVQRSDIANMLAAVRIHDRNGNDEASNELLAEAVQAAPEITGAEGWSELVQSRQTAAVLDAAAARWSLGDPSPRPLLHQEVWLAALLGNDAPQTSTMGAAVTADVMARLRCEGNPVELGEGASIPVDTPRIGPDATLNPLNEGSWWGYRRYPIFWPDVVEPLPDPRAGTARWLQSPADAVAEAGLEEELPACASAGR